MIFDLTKLKNDNIILTNEDDQFNDTDLQGQSFTSEIKRLSRADKIDVATESMTEDGKISSGKYSEAMFKAAIVDVDGFTDENHMAIPTDHAIGLIWEYAPDTLVEAIKAKIQSFDIMSEKKSEVSTTDFQDTPAG